jgi:hypothetical protein
VSNEFESPKSTSKTAVKATYDSVTKRGEPEACVRKKGEKRRNK